MLLYGAKNHRDFLTRANVNRVVLSSIHERLIRKVRSLQKQPKFHAFFYISHSPQRTIVDSSSESDESEFTVTVTGKICKEKCLMTTCGENIHADNPFSHKKISDSSASCSAYAVGPESVGSFGSCKGHKSISNIDMCCPFYYIAAYNTYDCQVKKKLEAMRSTCSSFHHLHVHRPEKC